MNLPPVFPGSPSINSEQRVTVRLRKYWDYLREERQFPAEKEILPNDLAAIWSNCFIVKADNSCKKEDYQYKYIGENITKAYGIDLTGLNVNKLVAPEAGHLADEYEHVLAFKRPVMDEGEITPSKNVVVKYRQILLPLGDDGVNIDAILGGMSYKLITGERKRSIFSRLSSKE